jgi:hypothetical protein
LKRAASARITIGQLESQSAALQKIGIFPN